MVDINLWQTGGEKSPSLRDARMRINYSKVNVKGD